MKSFDLNACGVSELNEMEMKKVDGGMVSIIVYRGGHLWILGIKVF